MSNPNLIELTTELTTELEEVRAIYRDLLDPILSLPQGDQEHMLKALQCMVRWEELPDELHDFLDSPMNKEVLQSSSWSQGRR